MKRWFFFLYGVVCHLLFLAVFAYMVGFVGNWLVPRSIDSAPFTPAPAAVAINLLLLALFAVPHSIMARPAFKRVWTRLVPTAIERSTYVLVSNLLMILLLWQWRSIDATVWNIQTPALRIAIWVLFAAGWLLVPLASFMINHFDLFGTRQVWLNLLGLKYENLPFRTPHLYRHIRHPLYVGWIISFWATPTMSAGHLLLAAALTLYIAVAVLFEERDLVAHFGKQYQQYRRQVPGFVPRLRTAKNTASADQQPAEPVHPVMQLAATEVKHD